MHPKGLRRFFLGIVLPSILAIILFIVSFYIVIIPSFEKNMMDGKRDMIRELTNSALSLVKEFYNESREGILTVDEAKEMAAQKVGQMRYGEESKDYFWITDMRPYMIMHPYRTELNGTDLSGYADPDGKRLFVEADSIVSREGEGYINYIWQWKDDTTRLVPKLSYVKGFPEWDWIIGTGIYIEDVAEEIRLLEKRLFRISLVIIMIIASALTYIVSQSLKTEKRRWEAEEKLKLSRQKYKTLVEASADATLMILEGRIIYTNQKLNVACRRERDEIIELGFDSLFTTDWENIASLFQEPGGSVTVETNMSLPDGVVSEVLLSVSKVKYDRKDGYIIIVREIDQERIMERETKKLDEELQISLQLMNQSVNQIIKEPLFCKLEDSVIHAAELMARRNRDVVFVKKDGLIIGAVTDRDLCERVLSTTAVPDTSVSSVMSAPVIRIAVSSFIHEALGLMNRAKTSHILVTDLKGSVKGYVSLTDILMLQGNTFDKLIKRIDSAVDRNDLKEAYRMVPVLAGALLDGGVRTEYLTRIISTVSDNICCKIIEMAIETTGDPPCRFSFIALGSEGREEQTLLTDQDNAIIFEDECDQGKAADYFLNLAEKINRDLDYIGYNYCKGEIMARNRQWTQPLSTWMKYFTNWINNSDPQSLLELSIFFDFRHVYGEISLCSALREHVNRITENKAVFFYHLSQTVTRFKPPAVLFGQIKGEHNHSDLNLVDLKKLIIPLVGFIRIYSIEHKLGPTNSMKRLRLLTDSGYIPVQISEEVSYAFPYLLSAMLKSQSGKILSGKEPDNITDVSRLTAIETAGFRKIISLINELLTKIKADFRGTIQ